MGAAREAVGTPTSTGIISDLRHLEDRLGDLIQIKVRDLQTEGEALRSRNEKSVAALRMAMKGVQEARAALLEY